MTNREKFAEQILDIACNGDSIAVNKLTSEPMRCQGTACEECLFNFEGNGFCTDRRKKWVNSEYVEPPVDWSKVAVDTPVLVRNVDGSNWRKRHFAKYQNGQIFTYNDGKTSWSTQRTTSWKQGKLVDEDE